MVTFSIDSLDFEDDEEARFGSDTDYATRFDSANSRLELADLTNSTVGYVPQDVGTDLVGGKYAQTVAEGKALADDGNVYDSIQTAVNNASSWVKIGPGQLAESIDITTDGMTVIGSGEQTIISGESGDNLIVYINATDVTVRDLKVVGGTGAGSNEDGVNFSTNTAGSVAHNVTVEDVGGVGFQLGADEVAVVDSVVRSCGTIGIDCTNQRCHILSCRVIDSGTRGIMARKSNGHDNIISNNFVKNSGDDGITVQADNVVYANRVTQSGNVGIDMFSNDNVVVNNRVSDSTFTDIDDRGSGNIVRDNLTESAN